MGTSWKISMYTQNQHHRKHIKVSQLLIFFQFGVDWTIWKYGPPGGQPCCLKCVRIGAFFMMYMIYFLFFFNVFIPDICFSSRYCDVFKLCLCSLSLPDCLRYLRVQVLSCSCCVWSVYALRIWLYLFLPCLTKTAACILTYAAPQIKEPDACTCVLVSQP